VRGTTSKIIVVSALTTIVGAILVDKTKTRVPGFSR
jgi:hypothetical protein